ncbi:MAG: hypothetical protein ACTHOF_14900 [Flavisolibacter sp.]
MELFITLIILAYLFLLYKRRDFKRDWEEDIYSPKERQ